MINKIKYSTSIDYTIPDSAKSIVKKKKKTKTANKVNTQAKNANKFCVCCGAVSQKQLCNTCKEKYQNLNNYLVKNNLHGSTWSGIKKGKFINLCIEYNKKFNLNGDKLFDYLYQHPEEIKTFILSHL